MVRHKYKKIEVKGHWQSYHIKNKKGVKVKKRRWKEPFTKKVIIETTITQPKRIVKKLKAKIMTKKIPIRYIEGFKKITKHKKREYTVNIDFERKLKTPEQVLIVKQDRRRSAKIEDFELFGHSHPSNGGKVSSISFADIASMTPLRPEFIVNSKTGETFVYNIENLKIYNEVDWKKTSKKGILIDGNRQYGLPIFKDKKWRDKIYKDTGIRV